MKTNFVHINKKNYYEYIILSLIILIGFLVRLYKINNPLADWHSFRQADTASVTRFFLQDGIDLLHPRYQDISRVQSGIFNPEGYRFVEFPIYNAIHSVLVKTFPYFSLEAWGRLLTILCSLISAYIIFLIGKRYLGDLGGLAATFFYLFLPYNIYFTRVILPDPMATTFALLALWFFIKYFDTGNSSELIFSSVTFSLALLIKPFTVFYGIPMLYLAVKKFGFRRLPKEKKLIFYGMVVIMPFLLWRIWMSRYPAGIPFWKWVFNEDGIRFRPAFWRWIFGERLGNLILGIWGLVIFAFGLLSSDNKGFINFFLLGMFLYVSVVATANVRHDYYQIFTIPAISLTLASGLKYIWNSKSFDKIISRGLLIFSIGMMLGIGAYQVKEFYKINHPEIIEAGEAVDRLTPKDAIIIAPYNGDTAFLYQTKRRGWPVVELPINDLINEGAEYYVSVNLNDPQTQEFKKEFKIVEETKTYLILDLRKTN